MSLRVLDLFSGIGGFSLGLERAGMHTVAFCEIDPYCRAVLAKRWPHVPCYDDVRAIHRVLIWGSIDLICGGFPCQDISIAGKGAGIDGERSGLWGEYARLIGELRPAYVIVENVAALLARGLGRVLGDLAALGYDTEWYCIPAAAVGAPHRRDRVWIVAYPNRRQRLESQREVQAGRASVSGGGEDVAHPDQPRLQGWLREVLRQCAGQRSTRESGSPGIDGHWLTEPAVGRVADGIPARVDRIRALGNAVVPQIPYLLGKAILEHEGLPRRWSGMP